MSGPGWHLINGDSQPGTSMQLAHGAALAQQQLPRGRYSAVCWHAGLLGGKVHYGSSPVCSPSWPGPAFGRAELVKQPIGQLPLQLCTCASQRRLQLWLFYWHDFLFPGWPGVSLSPVIALQPQNCLALWHQHQKAGKVAMKSKNVEQPSGG